MKNLKRYLAVSLMIIACASIAIAAEDKVFTHNKATFAKTSKFDGYKWNSAKILINEIPGESACMDCNDI